MILETVAGMLLAAALMLAVPVAVLAIQIFNAKAQPGTWPGEGLAEAGSPVRDSTVAVVMPAHDEAAGIGASIASVIAQLSRRDRLLVVADNCSDETARVARQAGAEVVERHDALRRGKGFALDFGIMALAASPPDTVVVVDADCLAAPGAIDRIARLSAATGRPVQALYLMHAPPGAPLTTRIAAFAWIVKNEVRASGFHRLGLPCQLMGSGMAFPWPIIRSAPLASAHIVEDLKLGLDLAVQGAAPLFCQQALVTSSFPLAAAGLATQRRRWEHGHFGVIASRGPGLLWTALRRRQPQLAAMTLDLCVPPLAALVMALCVVLAGAASVALWGASGWALIVSAAAMVLLAISVAVAWWRFGRGVVSARDLATVPWYVVAKLPTYARMAWARQTEWVRTRRDGRTP